MVDGTKKGISYFAGTLQIDSTPKGPKNIIVLYGVWRTFLWILKSTFNFKFLEIWAKFPLVLVTLFS